MKKMNLIQMESNVGGGWLSNALDGGTRNSCLFEKMVVGGAAGAVATAITGPGAAIGFIAGMYSGMVYGLNDC